MIPIDKTIESLIHKSFLDFSKNQKLDALSRQLYRLHQSGYKFKFLRTLKGEVDDLISLAEYHEPLHPEIDGFASIIKAEKLAALRLLKFNSAAELAKIENILDLPNQKTTATSSPLKPYTLKLYYCVILKRKEFYLLIDTNYHQYHWAIKRLIKALKS